MWNKKMGATRNPFLTSGLLDITCKACEVLYGERS